MIVWASGAAWAQSGATPGQAETTRGAQAASASTYLQSSGKFDSNLDQVRDRLVLSPEQLPLWRAYASKVDAYTGLYYREKPVLPSPEEAAPHQITRLVDNLQNRLAALEEIEVAAKGLHAALSPEQQKTANQMLLSTVPTFAAPASAMNAWPQDSRRQGNRPSEGGVRSRRSGGGWGGGAY